MADAKEIAKVMQEMARKSADEIAQRFAKAQANAALPIEQGGLGLRPDNTPMERAKAMGFDIDNPMFHGTDKEFSSFDMKKSADMGAHFGTADQANGFLINKYSRSPKEGGRILPVFLKSNKDLNIDFDPTIFPNEEMASSGKFFRNNLQRISDEMGIYDMYAAVRGGDEIAHKAINSANAADDAAEKLANKGDLRDFYESPKLKKTWNNTEKYIKQNGYDRINYENEIEGGGGSSAILNPANIRSRFAAFDPFLKNSSDILATAAPVAAGLGILGTGLSSQNALALPTADAQGNPIADVGSIKPVEHPLLDAAANIIDKYAITPIPMFEHPLTGTSNLLRSMGRPRSLAQKYSDYLGSVQDFGGLTDNIVAGTAKVLLKRFDPSSQQIADVLSKAN